MLLLSATVASLSTFVGFRSLQFSLACGKTSFHFHAALNARARHLIFVLCIKGSWHYCCCCSCCCLGCCCCHFDCCCWWCWPASCRLPTSCQGAFSTQLPFHLFLLSQFIKLLRHKQDSLSVGGCTRKWAKWAVWACVRQV